MFRRKFEQVEDEERCLPRSLSFSNLNEQESVDKAEDLWQQHLDELERCRQEQVRTSFCFISCVCFERKLESVYCDRSCRNRAFRYFKILPMLNGYRIM